jgi:hypothetical protein
MRVARPSTVEDKVWRAVQEAILAGWSVERFRREAREAWDGELREQREDAARDWDAK